MEPSENHSKNTYEQHTWEARHQGTAENSHTGHRTRTDVQVQDIYRGKWHYGYHMLYRHRKTTYHRNMVCFGYVTVNALHKSDN